MRNVLPIVLTTCICVGASAQDVSETRAANLQEFYKYSLLHLTVTGVPFPIDQKLLTCSPSEKDPKSFSCFSVPPATTPASEIVGRGSGFVVSASGHILTAAHLFGKPGRYQTFAIQGRLHSSTTSSFELAELVKIDWDLDLALLKLPRPGTISSKWYRVPIGNSRLLVDSAPVIVMGFPEELTTYQRATGYVTDLHGPKGWLQINANVSKGYSGGPVFNEFGEVIGVVTAGYVNGALKYAIPITYATGMLGLTGP